MRATRYALWSLLFIAPAIIILPAFATTHADFPGPLGADTGPLAAVGTAVALIVTAFVAPAVAYPEGKGFPAWSAAIAGLGLLQMLGILFGYGAKSPETDLSGAYLPGALVCLNLAALIGLHAWVAAEGMGRSPAVGLATGGAYGLWLLRVCSAQEFGMFQIVSSVGVALAFTVAVAAAFVGSASTKAAAKEPDGSA